MKRKKKKRVAFFDFENDTNESKSIKTSSKDNNSWTTREMNNEVMDQYIGTTRILL